MNDSGSIPQLRPGMFLHDVVDGFIALILQASPWGRSDGTDREVDKAACTIVMDGRIECGIVIRMFDVYRDMFNLIFISAHPSELKVIDFMLVKGGG